MSNYNSTATATIYVNGQPAQQTIAKLKDDVLGYRKRLQEIAADKSLGVNSKEWNDVRKKMVEAEKELGRVQSGVANVTQAMLRLDKATPAELRKSLKQLKSDLDNIERGSRAWGEHQRKIKAVKEELAKINNESKAVQGNLWDRFAKKMFDWGAAIQTVMAAFTGVTTTARKAVQAFAEMDQEMASVRKFTGMTADEVERLNDEFKTMDTRSSREQLNQLAQEAGRLGMQSQEDVMGFVRAADKINVALDDLGEGATLTLSKLTDIFGDRQRLGVEKSLLSVGSVINELSQNCTASAPYLAEFASRMGGVGAQAGMTTQQIMGFGAVLDTYNQKVESSSTALSQVIVRLYREPEKYAKVAGLEVKQFAELMKTDMNAALIQFLETLNKAGGMDVLSPMFKDMGENGARAIQALSTLATHIDDVKKQQEVANEAFNEAISIDKEFNVQNNTVQAGLEKAKKNFNEMAIALGEKLAPLMKYTITSSSAMMKVIAGTVEFFMQHKTSVANVIIVLAAYTIAVNRATMAVKLHELGIKAAALATSLWNAVLRAGSAIQRTFTAAVAYGHVVVTLFTKGATAARIEFAALNATIKANPFGLLLTVITAVVLAIVNLKGKTDEYTKAAKDNIKAAKGLSEEYYKEQRELDALFGKLEGAKKGTKEYESAKKSIISQYGRYLSGLIDEKGEIINLTDAYDRLTAAIRRSARERGIAAAREKNTEEYFSTLSNDLKELQDALEKTGASAKEAARIVQKVSDAATSGKALDKNTSDWIRAYSSRDGWNNVFSPGKTPWGIANKIFNRNDEYNKSERTFTAMEQAVAPYRNIPEDRLSRSLVQLDKIILSGKAGEALVIVGGDSADEYRKVSVKEAKSLVQGIREELNYRRGNSSSSMQPENPSSGPGYSPSSKSDKNSSHQKTEDKFKAEKEWKEREEALNTIAYRTGEKNYEEYMIRQLQIEVEYNRKRLDNSKITSDEYIKVNAELQEALAKQNENYHKMSLADEEAAYNEQVAQVKQYYLDNLISREAYEGKLKELELQHLWRVDHLQRHAAALPGADESAMNAARQAHEKYQQGLIQDQMENQKAYEDKLKKHTARLDEVWERYFETDEEKRVEFYRTTRNLIEEAYEREIEKAGYTAEEKLEIERRYRKALAKLDEEEDEKRNLPSYLTKKKGEPMTLGERVKKKIASPLKDVFNDDELAALDQTLDYAYNSFASLYESLGQMWRNEEEMKLAALEQRYDREISMAEGNAYKIKEIEKKKNREQAKIKAEAQKRQFSQQVLSAIAQTATAAINAYSSAAAIPVVGHVLAPIAAAMATAAGLMQVAVIKQQMSLSNAQGYAEGGFTPDGPKDKPVGIVHAGEWVASQKLLKNPATRPAIEALDFAQRNNRFGDLPPAAVTRIVTAPAVIASAATDGSMSRAIAAMSLVIGEYSETMEGLRGRLEKPFVTINTVSGDRGMKKAQDEFTQLENNTLPKSKRK